jgi:dnd system-associated protein 4
MAQVRIAGTGETLLPFCKPWTERRENAIFSTYYDLILFAAACGFKHLKGKKAPQCVAFMTQPYPVPFEYFKSDSQMTFPLILLLSLGAFKQHDVVKDDDRLVKMLEDYAAVGFEVLAGLLTSTTPESFHIELARLLTDTCKEVQKKG